MLHRSYWDVSNVSFDHYTVLLLPHFCGSFYVKGEVCQKLWSETYCTIAVNTVEGLTTPKNETCYTQTLCLYNTKKNVKKKVQCILTACDIINCALYRETSLATRNIGYVPVWHQKNSKSRLSEPDKATITVHLFLAQIMTVLRKLI